MKAFLLSLFFLITTLSSGAQQKKLGFIAGLNIGYPLKTINAEGSNIMAAGVELNVHYDIYAMVAVTMDIGYTVALNGEGSAEIIPLRTGIRYYPSNKFFIGGKFGAGFVKNGGFATVNGGYTPAIAYALNTGFKITRHFEMSASYEVYSKEQTELNGFKQNKMINIINLKLGYWF
jgi:hypothetical protein